MDQSAAVPGSEAYRPQYERIAERIIEYIARARLSPGDRLPTEQKLGDQLGVSRSVVREAVKFLSATGLIVTRRGAGLFVADRSQMRERMSLFAESMGLSLAAEHGSLESASLHGAEFPQLAPQPERVRVATMPTRRTRLVDLVVADLVTHYDFAIIQGVEAALSEAGMRPVLSVAADERGGETHWSRQINPQLTEGAILVQAVGGVTVNPALLAKQFFPLVVVDSYGEVKPDIPSVGATNWSGARQATDHLIQLGHRRIAIISGTPSFISAQARLAGYRAALEAAEIPVDPRLIRPGHFKGESGYLQTLALLDLADRPTAIFAASDIQALGVYRALRERAIAVPDQMSVVGFDGDPRGADLVPPLTTVYQPLAEMGKMAAKMLVQLINAQPLDSQRIEIATSLLVRHSTSAPGR